MPQILYEIQDYILLAVATALFIHTSLKALQPVCMECTAEASGK